MMARALSTWHAGLSQVVIVGDPARGDTQQLGAIVANAYLPFALVLPVQPGDPQAGLALRMPWIGGMTMRDGRATAYVCRNFACELTTTDLDKLGELLEKPE